MNADLRATALLLVALVVLSFFAYRETQRPDEPSPAPMASLFVPGARPAETTVIPVYGSTVTVLAERDRKIAAAAAKYGDRLVVREFMADLKNDPCAAKAIADEKVQDMIGALSAARRAGCLDKLKREYLLRPQFIKLMAEVMSDPDLRPLLLPLASDTAAPGDVKDIKSK